MMRVFWIALGLSALVLGIIGVLLPVLPTTPFVILAAFAFGKGSDRLRGWLVNNAIFGPMIREWEAHGAIAPRYKRIAYMFMALAFLGSLIAGVRPVILFVQAVCLSSAGLYIWTRPDGPDG